MATARLTRRSTRSGRRSIGRGWIAATYVALVIFALWTGIPFLWMILTSIKTNKEIYDEFTVLPNTIYWGHYASLLTGPFMVWLRNSATIGIVTTTLSIGLGSLGAYSVTRLSYVGRGIAARGLIFTYLVPGSLLFIPLFQIVSALG